MHMRATVSGPTLLLATCALAAGAAISGCSGSLPAFDLPNADTSGDVANPTAAGSSTESVALALPSLTTLTPMTQADGALESFLLSQQIEEMPAYREAVVDLDADGTDDLMLLLEGRNWCSRRGCSLLVFHATADGDFRLVTRTTNTRAPIAISSHRHQGWHDLLVGVGGGNSDDGTVVLQFNGEGYPADPSLSALLAAQSLPSARTVIE